MTVRVWLFIAFAFFVVGCIVLVALKALNNDKSEKVALAVITGLLSLISGGVGSFVTGSTVQESAKEAGKAAAKVEKNVSTKATKEAAKSAAENVSGQVSKEVTQAIEAQGSTGTTPKAGTAPKK